MKRHRLKPDAESVVAPCTHKNVQLARRAQLADDTWNILNINCGFWQTNTGAPCSLQQTGTYLAHVVAAGAWCIGSLHIL